MATQSEMNAFMKYLEMLLSPEFAVLTGTYDPLSMVDEGEESSLPFTESLLASPNEDIKGVFSGLVSGQLDPISAKQQLFDALGPDSSTWVSSAVDTAFEEISESGPSSSRSSKKKDKTMFEEGYLPDPLETYSQMPELAPMAPEVQNRLSKIDENLAKISSITSPQSKSKFGGVMKKALLSQGLGLDTSGLDPAVAKQIQSLSPARKKALVKTLEGERVKQEGLRQEYLTRNVQSLESAGRTPFVDTLSRRAAMLSQLRGMK